MSAPRPLVDRGLGAVARGLAWPLALGLAVAGAALRLLGLGLAVVLPRRGRGAVAGRRADLRGYVVAAGRHLAWRTDLVPPLVGRMPGPTDSPGPWNQARRRLARNRVGVVAGLGALVYVYVALGALFGLVAPDFAVSDPSQVYAPPAGLGHANVMGTDQIGRDVAAVGLRGTLTALWIGTFSALLACVVGTVLGAAAGFFGGWVDMAVVWLYTTLESVPDLLLLLSLAYLLRKNAGFVAWYDASVLATTLHVSVGLFTVVVALGLTSWTGVCRVVRGETLRHRDRDYVVAARALGVPTRRIVLGHVLPNVMHLVLVSFSLLFVGAIKAEVILSFLGIGLDAGEASWGNMIGHAKLELTREPTVWWQLATASVLMFGLVLCVNLFADALRDALDPRLKT